MGRGNSEPMAAVWDLIRIQSGRAGSDVICFISRRGERLNGASRSGDWLRTLLPGLCG